MKLDKVEKRVSFKLLQFKGFEIKRECEIGERRKRSYLKKKCKNLKFFKFKKKNVKFEKAEKGGCL